MSRLYPLALLASFFSLGQEAACADTTSETLTTAKLIFVEALDPKDTTSSQRFQDVYEAAIAKGKELTATSLAKCGYRLETKSFFYGASDPLQAKEQAEKASKEGAWLIVGPRRSNHYLLLAKGAPKTPTVSIMASSEDVASLGKLHLSLAPTNAAMAKAAALEAAERVKGTGNQSYLSIVSSECLSCKDFSKQFDSVASQAGLKKIEELTVVGERPDLSSVQKALEREKPAFVLLPNYSIVTSYLISQLQETTSGLFFVGGDGWGDSKFGFVQNGLKVASASGFTVRGNPPSVQGLKTFSLGKAILARGEAQAFESSSALAILKAIDSTAALLCVSKPKKADEFAASFVANGHARYSSPWGITFLNLDKGNLVYLKSKEIR